MSSNVSVQCVILHENLCRKTSTRGNLLWVSKPDVNNKEILKRFGSTFRKFVGVLNKSPCKNSDTGRAVWGSVA